MVVTGVALTGIVFRESFDRSGSDMRGIDRHGNDPW